MDSSKDRLHIKRGIGMKLLITMVGLIACMMTILTFLQIRVQKKELRRELDRRIVLMKEKLQERGWSLSENLAFRVENDLAAFNLSGLQELLHATVKEDRDLEYVILMARERLAFFHTARPELEQETLNRPEDYFAEEVSATRTNEYEKDGQSYLEFIIPLYVSTEQWGVLRAGFSLSTLNREIISSRAENSRRVNDMIAQSVLTAFVSILLGFILITVLSARLSRPLIALTLSAKELAQGNFSAAERIRSFSGDEVGVLAATFVEMTHKLKTSYDLLEDYNKNLERKVAERTSELEEKNRELQALERIVKVINREVEMERLLHALIGQAVTFLNKANAGIFIIREREGDSTFRVGTTIGFEAAGDADLIIKQEDLQTFFAENKEELNTGIFRLRPPFANDKLALKPEPKALISMPIESSEQLEGYLILANTEEVGAFRESDVERLRLFREHAVSALEKARILHTLKRKNEELLNYQQDLVQAEKMASLGGLVAGVAHEINTPIGTGLTAITHLRDKTSDISNSYGSKQLSEALFRDYLNTSWEVSRMLVRNLEQASELVRSFKRVAVDQSSDERRRFRLKQYFEEVLLSLAPNFKQTHLTIKLVCDDDAEIDSYPGSLCQVLTNFLMNSLKHAYDKGDKGLITITLSHEKNKIRLIYKDDGKGIPPENLPKIYEPFFTTRRAKGGVGLGLHIVFNIVTQKLGGSIQCTSTPNEGVTFTVTFPLVAPYAAPPVNDAGQHAARQDTGV